MEWTIKKFTELTTTELYTLLRLRSEVFVVEQDCVYPDLDGKDFPALHVMAWEGDTLMAYTRILPPGISYDEASIGRVVTAPIARNTGLGRILMEKTIAFTRKAYPGTAIRISAQEHLKGFYSSLGFTVMSETYLEDGIPHIEMLLV